MNQTLTKINFLRYPGGKQRFLNYLAEHLPTKETIKGRFVEPFVGGGAVFFALNPQRAILSDVNKELTDLYLGIKQFPVEIWGKFEEFPSTKEGYYQIRNVDVKELDLVTRTARTLYLNRTCFKGMWRHNSNGQFNVGYGGQSRRWVINKEILIEVSKRLNKALILNNDYEEVIDNCERGDFLFVDPPYRPGKRETIGEHYAFCKFLFEDYQKLAKVLERASHRKVKWAITISSHPDILCLFEHSHFFKLPKGTGKKPGELVSDAQEVLILNY